MNLRLRIQSCIVLACAAVTLGLPAWLMAEERKAPPRYGQFNPDHKSVEMFAAMAAGQVEVKLIPKDSTQARVFIKNMTDQPLNVQLPEAFAGVPVLAQCGFCGFCGGAGGGCAGGGAQAMGGGMMGGMGGMGGMGMGGGFFNIAPEKVGEIKAACVCLEHGKDDPRPAIPYEIRPLESYTEDPALQELIKLFAKGRIDQRVAQAAAWHFSSKMSWQQLAAKRIQRANSVSYPWFSPRELQAAMQLAGHAEQLAANEQPEQSPGETAANP